MMQFAYPCVAVSQVQLLVIWGVILSATALLAWPWLFSRFARMKKIVAVPMLVMAMMVGLPTSVFATTPTPENCYWLQASGLSCWVLENIFWCPCGDDPPPPPPPPPG